MKLLTFILINGPLAVSFFTLCILLILTFYGYKKWQAGYETFLSLGRGGTPYNALGYTIVSIKAMFGIDPLSYPPIPTDLDQQIGYLDETQLHHRPGSRPVIKGVAPQRQVDQAAPYDIVQNDVCDLINQNEHICLRTSFLERHGPAFFPTDMNSSRPSERIFGAEIGHVHEYDGSVHVNLHPADVAKVIQYGWAERHGLARGDSLWFMYFRDFWRFFGYADARPPVSVGWVLVYAPRTHQERMIVLRIIGAGAQWITNTPVLHPDDM
ncbi:hypothetical protein B0J11DRAFT_437924 [Dendryphion nanum]|uniref:Luciferase domain-containing protein n=1 Tax=Dendryphion nanum TaxID=256645 RepID=A0A9P9IKG3_9PLEO|nr:hypothetical protein B0J11DRAFT_437924 [Dendryphion nanum]